MKVRRKSSSSHLLILSASSVMKMLCESWNSSAFFKHNVQMQTGMPCVFSHLLISLSWSCSARMLEDFGQEVDLIGTEDGSNRSFLWTRLKYVPIGKSTKKHTCGVQMNADFGQHSEKGMPTMRNGDKKTRQLCNLSLCLRPFTVQGKKDAYTDPPTHPTTCQQMKKNSYIFVLQGGKLG